MILDNWQIKVLQHYLLDYKGWIKNVETCELFSKPDEIIQNKINVCFDRILKEYSQLDFVDLKDDEKINLIINLTNYKNRVEKENIIQD